MRKIPLQDKALFLLMGTNSNVLRYMLNLIPKCYTWVLTTMSVKICRTITVRTDKYFCYRVLLVVSY